MRARNAAMKPKAAAMAPSVSGTTSWRAPQGRPPSGRWESIAAKPKGRGLRNDSPSPPGRGMSRRSSSITAARFRANVGASGPVIVESPIVESALDILCMF